MSGSSINFLQRRVIQRTSAHSIALVLVGGAIAFTQVSIAASQILLACSILAWSWYRFHHSGKFVFPSLAWPLLAFFLWSVVASLSSPYLQANLVSLKKFVLFSIVFLIPDLCRLRNSRAGIYQAIFITAAVGSGAGLLEYVTSSTRDLDHRVTGLMSHWMTYSGLLMLIVPALGAYLLSYGFRKSWWALPLGVAAGTGIFLSQTRSTFVAALIGLGAVLFVLRRYRWILALLFAVVAIYFVSPESFKERFKAGLDAGHEHTRPRLELIETGMRMIEAHPITGVGPGAVSIEAPKFKSPEARPEWTYIHLHNNLLQIAAERGIPGLLLWLWIICSILFKSYKGVSCCLSEPVPDPEKVMVSSAAAGATIALLAGGMLEYNFGDSEILMLFLFMASAPYADEVSGKSVCQPE